MSKYFKVTGDLIVFENTGDLAREINDIISTLRSLASQIPHIGEQAHSYFKKKTPGPTKVKAGVRAALRNNAFNYRTRRFEYQRWNPGVTRVVNHYVNRAIGNAEASMMTEVGARVETITSDYVNMFLLEQLSRTMLPEAIKTRAANQITLLLVTKLSEAV